MVFPLPRHLAEHAEQRGRTEWISSLPTTVDWLKDYWTLEVANPFQPGGQTAWVAPALNARFGDVVLKVACRHDEAADEAKGLREWNGTGTVRLLAVEEINEAATALLLERCHPGSALSVQPDEVQDQVVAELLRALWREPPFTEDFRPLQNMCDMWADSCEQKLFGRPLDVDTGRVREGIELFRTLPASSERHVLLCTDLHADNVFAAERRPWLVIDPKPYVGDPTYDVLQHLVNCEDRLLVNPHDLIKHQAGLCGLDADRLTLWLFARCVIETPNRPELLGIARRIAPK